MLDLSSIQAGQPNVPSSRRSTRPPINRASTARLSYFGRPGSKRFQRFVNKSFLLDNEDDLNAEDLVVFSSTSTALTLICEESNKKIWEPFVSVTEEQQKNMIAIIEPTRGTAAEVPLSSARSFASIEVKIRKVLKANIDSEFFLSLEKELLNYIESDDVSTLEYSFPEAYHRMLCHGICQYYNLKSISKNDKGGRILVVDKKKESRNPGETLIQHLRRNRWN
jgi:hypothetical protein